MIALPFVQSFLLFHTFGEFGLKVTLVNDEVIGFGDCHNTSLKTTFLHNNTCDLNKISCRFIKHLIKSKVAYNIMSNMNDVDGKKTHAIVFFASNYTESYTDLRDHKMNVGDGSIANSKIQVFLSNTNVFVDSFLEAALMKSTLSFIHELLVDCGLSAKLNLQPISFEEPIYGKKEFNVRNYIVCPLQMM